MIRRNFIKSLLATAGFSMLQFPGCKNRINSLSADVYEGFKNPPGQVRPYYRWWWNGNRISTAEIIRELKLIKASGAGGVEINPIALHEIYQNPHGEPLDWLSPKWNELLQVTVEESLKAGLICDLIVGTGWPFGGEFLSDEETIQGVQLTIKPVIGPGTFSERLLPKGDGLNKIMHVVLFPESIQRLAEGIDFTSQVTTEGLLQFKIPTGKWHLYMLTWRNKFREVLFGAHGADGPALDHFNKNAVTKYLNRMSDALNPYFNGKIGNGFRSMFCDSIELEGANWTTDFSAEFEKRRGYPIEPYLLLVLNLQAKLDADLADTISRVRYDYSKTLSELFMERFIEPFHHWCRENGTLSRYQAYGHPWLYTDLLDGYLIPDIPESDQWLFNPGWEKQAILDDIRYATWNKYASSAAHLMGQKVVSCEAMTNTRGVFQASLEYIKQATDINIITGVNHLVLHGYNYSPPEAGFPGWIRFGTYFNENNPWWPYLPRWMDYAARLSYIFQESQPVAQVAILGPTLDIWSQKGLDRNPWITTPWYLHILWQALNHHGYFADYLNSQILQKATFRNGDIHFGPMKYQILILANVETLEPETAKALYQYAENKGKIAFIGKKPQLAPGLINHQNNTQVQNWIHQAFEEFPNSLKVIPEPTEDILLNWAGNLMHSFSIKPAVRISNPDPKLFFIHHRKAEQEIFFFSNMDRNREISFEAQFSTGTKTPWQWNPETGERFIYPCNKKKNQFKIKLNPLESLLLIFETDDQKSPEVLLEGKSETYLKIEGTWQVEFKPVSGHRFSKELIELIDFSTVPDLQNFSGTAIYRTEFEVKEAGSFILDLGRVHEIAEVRLNNHDLSTRWWGKRQYHLKDFVKIGTNILEIKVTTLLYNYCRSLQDNPVVQHWTIEHSKNQQWLPSGLIGPVQILKIGI
ncbi:hypothetical protein JW964_08030 [candidate division KSB1 bacterium]|nr:hypothetical protein [candidate division KSB1 bacterium]